VGEQLSSWSYLTCKRLSTIESVLCFVQTNRVRAVFFAKCTVNEVVYLDMLEGFLIPILEEAPDDVLFQQDGAYAHFHWEVTDFFKRRFVEQSVGLGGGGGGGGGYILVTYFPWPYFPYLGWAVRLGCCVSASVGCHFAGTCCEDMRSSGYSCPRFT
jgi:hypothetical protein